MKRIVYISGRYRVWYATGAKDYGSMNAQVADEQWWSGIVLECGAVPIPPLCMSCPLDTGQDIDWVGNDLAIIQRLTPGFDCILLRPGWDNDPESQGTIREYDCAREVGLLVIHGCQGEAAVRAYLAGLEAEVTA